MNFQNFAKSILCESPDHVDLKIDDKEYQLSFNQQKNKPVTFLHDKLALYKFATKYQGDLERYDVDLGFATFFSPTLTHAKMAEKIYSDSIEDSEKYLQILLKDPKKQQVYEKLKDHHKFLTAGFENSNIFAIPRSRQGRFWNLLKEEGVVVLSTWEFNKKVLEKLTIPAVMRYFKKFEGVIVNADQILIERTENEPLISADQIGEIESLRPFEKEISGWFKLLHIATNKGERQAIKYEIERILKKYNLDPKRYGISNDILKSSQHAAQRLLGKSKEETVAKVKAKAMTSEQIFSKNTKIDLLCEQISKYYNTTLNKKFWSDKQQFDQEVRENLLIIAKDFYDSLEVKVPILDIQLTGSLANYNYSDYSDLDVHLIVDFEHINEDAELVKMALDGQRFIWNERHDIVIKDHDVELYIQDVSEQHTSSGLYSLSRDKWLRKPLYNPPEIDEKDVKLKEQYYTKEILKMEERLKEKSLSEEDFKNIEKRAKKLKEKIQKGRKECLQEGGEFCVENLVFKNLRNSGMIGKLIEIASKAYDKQFSS